MSIGSRPDGIARAGEAGFDLLAELDALLELPVEGRARRLGEIDATDPNAAVVLRRWLVADAGPARSTLDPARYAALLEDEPGEPETEASSLIGPWRLLRELGRGGMGSVWLAERADGQYEQQVALKLIKRGMDSDAVERRFLAERQILARLDHPNVARLIDGGVAADGRPYFALEYVDGAPLLEFARAEGLDLRSRLALFVKLCAAVAYAHARLVVHRDLKPSNMLVQANGEPKLLDFGIAKVLGGDDDPDGATATAQGQRYFTPAYAAPEQLSGEPISTATDTYALGLVLYELLTGVRVDGVASATRSTDRPSTARTRAGSRGPDAVRPQQLKGDLDTIVLRALAPEPARRYAGAQALADDLERYLDGRPVRAQPDRMGYRARKFAQRHKVGVAAGVAVATALVAATAVSLYQARIAREQAELAQRESSAAQAVKAFLLDAFTSADPYKSEGREPSARDLLEGGAARIDAALGDQPLVRAELHEAFGDTFAKLDRIPLADAQYEKALAAYRAAGAGDGPAAMGVEVGRLNTRFEAARLEGLEADLRAVLARIGERKELLAPRSDALTLLSFTLWTQGRYPEAAQVGEELLALSEREHGAVDRATGFAVYALSLVRFDQGQLGPAAELLERYVAIDVQTLGPDSPGLVTDLQAIARLLGEVGQAERALPIIRAAVEARLRHFGANHRLSASARARLAATEALLGDRSAAETHYREALSTLAQNLGSGHDKLAALQQEFARFLATGGARDEARTLLREADATWLRLGGEAHPRHRACAAALAELGARSGDAGASARLEALAQEQLKSADADAPHSLAVLGELALTEGPRERALEHYQGAARAVRAQQREGSPLAQQIETALTKLGAPDAGLETPNPALGARIARLEGMAQGIIARAGAPATKH